MSKIPLPPNSVRPMTLSYILMIANALIVSLYWMIAQPVIPLLYSLALPAQQLVSKNWIFVVPVISLVINIFHSIILVKIANYNKIIHTLFGSTTMIIQVLLLLSIVRIVYITF